jgi:hypothetical protein
LLNVTLQRRQIFFEIEKFKHKWVFEHIVGHGDVLAATSKARRSKRRAPIFRSSSRTDQLSRAASIS